LTSFKQLKASKNEFWGKNLKISQWITSQAPPNYDLIWENLAQPPQ
jgi:hypothetical protein